MQFILLFVVPTLGVLWFVNFTTFLKNVKNDKSTRIQTGLGIVLTFGSIFALMSGFVGTL